MSHANRNPIITMNVKALMRRAKSLSESQTENMDILGDGQHESKIDRIHQCVLNLHQARTN